MTNDFWKLSTKRMTNYSSHHKKTALLLKSAVFSTNFEGSDKYNGRKTFFNEFSKERD